MLFLATYAVLTPTGLMAGAMPPVRMRILTTIIVALVNTISIMRRLTGSAIPAGPGAGNQTITAGAGKS
jgi:hypothetical protein